jgi:Protein of unknown function (DUF2384)
LPEADRDRADAMNRLSSLAPLTNFLTSLAEFWNIDESELVRTDDLDKRVRTLLQIRATLSVLFQDRTVENAWLRRPKTGLDNHCPIDLIRDGSIDSLVNLKRYVLWYAD